MIVTSLNEIKNLEEILINTDALMAGCDLFSTINYESFTKDELKFIMNACHMHNKKFVLKLNLMLHEPMINEFRSFVLEFLNADLFYVTDLGALNILKELTNMEKIIYDPNTLICNHLDALIYSNDSKLTIGLSEEITLNDVNKIASYVNENIFYKIFGYQQMSFSKRHLVSLYLEENKINSRNKKGIYYLKEETRNELYPVLEREYGTIIFRSYVLNLLKELKNINARYLFIETFLLNSEQIKAILKCIKGILNNEIACDKALGIIKELGLQSEDGFLYNDTVYIKVGDTNV